MAKTPTTSQTVGPFFSIGLDALLRGHLAPVNVSGNSATVRGRVLDGDGQPVPDAVLEIWEPLQGSEGPDASGYPSGFGRVATNDLGEFQFRVNRRAAGRSDDGSVQAPHVVVLVFMRGLLRHLVTRLYFADDPANEEDAVLNLVPRDRRATLIAAAAAHEPGQFLWEIRLQGERETVFFEI